MSAQPDSSSARRHCGRIPGTNCSNSSRSTTRARTPLGSSGKYEYTRVDLVRGNFEKQGACDNGRHRMTSVGRFGLTIWGWGSSATGGSFFGGGAGFFTQAVSYAYPAGANVTRLNHVTLSAQ